MKLLIAIPTFNRIHHLTEQLSRLRFLIDRLDDLEVDVLVYDNGNDEQTKELVSSFDFIYKANPTNYGADMNMILCFYESVGYDYFWLLSDDDYIIIDSFYLVLNNLLNNNGDLIVMKKSDYNSVLSSDENSYNIINIDDFMQLGTGLISSSIYKLNVFLDHFDELVPNWKTGFPHLRLQLAILKNGSLDITLWLGEFFDDNRVTAISDSLGYKKALYGFLLLFEDFPRRVRQHMSSTWWKSYRQRYLAIRWKTYSRANYVLWYDFMKQNIRLFKIRFYGFMIFLYPLGIILEKLRHKKVFKSFISLIERKTL